MDTWVTSSFQYCHESAGVGGCLWECVVRECLGGNLWVKDVSGLSSERYYQITVRELVQFMFVATGYKSRHLIPVLVDFLRFFFASLIG